MKYKNTKTLIDGHLFDSKLEADYYLYLKERQTQGHIKRLELQPHYVLVPSFKYHGKTVRKMEYIADFYVEFANGDKVAIDTKGVETDAFKLKKKLLHFRYPKLTLQIVKRVGGKWVISE